MLRDDLDGILQWLLQRGLAGTDETLVVREFCERCNAAGLPIARAIAIVDTLHPIYEGRAFRWRNDGVEEESLVQYGSSEVGEAAAEWRRSPFFHMDEGGLAELQVRLDVAEAELRFPILAKSRAVGHTDALCLVHRFDDPAEAEGRRLGSIGMMDRVYSMWSTRRAGGFRAEDVAALRTLAPALCVVLKAASLARITETLVEVYLGRDPGRRVLSGRISRGIADRISAVLWFSDLRGYTTISDKAAPEEVMPLLDDYAGAVIGAIHATGGDVLKLMGDGVMAIFTGPTPSDAARAALAAEAKLRAKIAKLNARRSGEERPVTEVYLGLHIGDVFYGNIGSEDRLDFTVVGAAVNEVSRIANMCRSADRPVLMSSAFAAALPPAERARIVSVGRFALRGVGRAQELFTIDPGFM